MKALFLVMVLVVTSLSAFANQKQDEFRASLLLGQFSIEKNDCNEGCLEKLTNLKVAFEKIKGQKETEEIILSNVLGGNLVSELSTPMKEAINTVYPEWKKAYPELKLNKHRSLHMSCNSGLIEITQIQESEEDDALYTYFEMKSFSQVIYPELQRDFLDEKTIAFYDEEDNLVAQFNTEKKSGYYLADGKKQKARDCEIKSL